MPGQACARFRATSVAGYAHAGLAKDGEVEDYRVTIVAAKGSSSRAGPATSLDLWAAAFAAQPSSQQTTSATQQWQLAEPIWRSVGPAPWHSSEAALSDTTMQHRKLAELDLLDPLKVVDLALEEVASVEHRPTSVRAVSGFLDEQLVDRLFEEEMDLLLFDNGSGGAI